MHNQSITKLSALQLCVFARFLSKSQFLKERKEFSLYKDQIIIPNLPQALFMDINLLIFLPAIFHLQICVNEN